MGPCELVLVLVACGLSYLLGVNLGIARGVRAVMGQPDQWAQAAERGRSIGVCVAIRAALPLIDHLATQASADPAEVKLALQGLEQQATAASRSVLREALGPSDGGSQAAKTNHD